MRDQRRDQGALAILTSLNTGMFAFESRSRNVQAKVVQVVERRQRVAEQKFGLGIRMPPDPLAESGAQPATGYPIGVQDLVETDPQLGGRKPDPAQPLEPL